MTSSRRSSPRGTLPRALVAVALLVALVGCAGPTESPVSAFEVSELTVSAGQAEILAGDEVEVKAKVENSGAAAGAYVAELSVDGAVADHQDVTLDPGQATTLRFVVKAGPPGDHQITIGAATATLQVTAAPAFRVSGLRLASARPEILAGDLLDFVVEVANGGTIAGTYDAALSVDGIVQAHQSVSVEVGASATVRFSIAAGMPGTHTVGVGDVRTAFTVLAPASLSVTDLQLTKAGVPTNGDVEAVVTVENRGDAIGTLAVAVTVDGKAVATRDVTVGGGSRLEVQFPLVVPKPGSHVVVAGAFERKLVVWKITRPSNGTILVNKIKGGMGRLTIKNGDDDQDVVVVLASTSKPTKALLAVYVRSNKSVTIRSIKDGSYVAYFTFGDDWDSFSKTFTSGRDRRRFAETMRFKTTRTATTIRYSIVTLSLHEGTGTSTPTDPVADEDFPSVP